MTNVLFEREWLGHNPNAVLDAGRREEANQPI
jgi:hypothetical protein